MCKTKWWEQSAGTLPPLLLGKGKVKDHVLATLGFCHLKVTVSRHHTFLLEGTFIIILQNIKGLYLLEQKVMLVETKWAMQLTSSLLGCGASLLDLINFLQLSTIFTQFKYYRVQLTIINQSDSMICSEKETYFTLQWSPGLSPSASFFIITIPQGLKTQIA